MSEIKIKNKDLADASLPPSDFTTIFVDAADKHLKQKDDAGNVIDLTASATFTDEQAQDAVGNILVDTPDINLTYNDAVPEIKADLTNSGTPVGTFGSSSQVPQVTVDAKGRITNISNVSLPPQFDAEAAQDAVGGILEDSVEIAMTYNDGVPSIVSTLQPSGVTPGTYGSTSQSTQVAVDAKGRITSISNQSITPGSIGAQPLDSDLTAIAGLSTNGLVAKTGAGTAEARTLQAGAGISITNGDGVSGNPQIESTITQYTDEQAQDAVGGILTDSAEIDLVYNDGANTIEANLLPTSVSAGTYGSATQVPQVTFDAKGRATGASSVGIAIPSTQVTDFVEAAQDAAGAMATNGSGINLTYDDGANTLTPSLNVNSLTAKPEPSFNDKFLVYDVTGADHKTVTQRDILAFNNDYFAWQWSDFINNTLGDLTAQNTGTNASSQAGTYGINDTENARGVVQSDTGSTATGRAGLGSASSNQFYLGPNDLYCLEARLALEALSVTGVDQFYFTFGLRSDFTTIPQSSQFVGFRYRDDVNGGRIEFGSSRDANAQFVDTGVLMDINYRVFKIEATATQVRGFIDGVLVATITDLANIPEGSTRLMGWSWQLQKQVGVNQRNMSADWYTFLYKRNSAR